MQYTVLLLFTIFSFSLISQNDNWLNDADITHLVEVEATVSLQEVIYHDRANEIPGWERLKMVPECSQQGELSDRLRNMLLDQIEQGKLITQTTDQDRYLTLDEVNTYFYVLDTIATFDPATFEEVIQIVYTEQRIGALRLKTQLAWNASKNKLQTKVIGFYVIGDQYTDRKTFFYVSLPKLPNSTFDIHDKNWGWVGQSELTLYWETAKVLKGSSVIDFLDEAFLEQAIRRASFPVYEQGCDQEPVSSDKLILMVSTTDTVITFDPDTYEEKVVIVRNDLEAKDLSSARLGLQCYFNMDFTQLFFSTKYISPMVATENNKGIVLFHRPLYYIPLE